MGFIRDGTVIRDGDDLRLQGIAPGGIAVAGAVIYRAAGPPIEPPIEWPRPFITSVIPAPIDTANSGLIGIQVNVGAAPLRVTALGFWALAQNTAAATIYLLDPNWSILGTVTINTSASPPGQFVYAAVAPAAMLLAAHTYFLLLSGATAWLAASPVTTTADASVFAAVGMTAQQAGHAYGPLNFLYEMG